MVLVALVAPVVGAEDASAQEPESTRNAAADADATGDASRPQLVLWSFEAPDLTSEQLTAVHRGLEAALTAESGRHLLGEKAFRDHIAGRSAALPDCLKGLEPCGSAETLAFEAVGVSVVLRVAIESADERLEATYEMVDRRGEVARSDSVSADDARELAFELAGEIFDATATVTIQSEPTGATVAIDGEEAGTTPLSLRLPIGEHHYSVHLDTYRPVEESVELRSSGAEILRHELERLPAVLVIEGAPAGADVLINGQMRGGVGEALELEPGTYTVEVRAEGYDSWRDTVALEAGDEVQRSASLDESHPLLTDVAPNAIAVNSYIGRLSYDHSLHNTTFRDARGESNGTRFEFGGFTENDSPLVVQEDLRRFTDPNGLRFDFTYSWENFGLVLLSTSYASSTLDLPAVIESSAADQPVAVTVTDMSRLQLRPLQVRYRHFYKNLAPFIELGTGINIQWVEVEGDLLEEPVTLSNSEAFWTLGLGGSYYVTPNVFGMARYGAQFYFDDGLGVENVFSLGIGVALPNLFGFEPEPPERL